VAALGAVTKTASVHNGDVVTPVSKEIQDDFSAAYSALAKKHCPKGNTLTTLIGKVLAPGTYCFDQASTNTGAL